MDRFLVLVLGWALSILIFKYRRPIKEFVGDVGFAERYLGAGGTNTLILIIGFLTFVLSLMYALGTIQGIIVNTFGMFF